MAQAAPIEIAQAASIEMAQTAPVEEPIAEPFMATEEPLPAPAPEPAVAIDSFASIVARAEAMDVRLYHHLMENVHLVDFRPGHLEIRPNDNAPADLANRLRGSLESWTGATWAVVINGQAEGQPPLAAQQRQVEADIRTEAENDPLVRAALDAFPGAKVTEVRPISHMPGHMPGSLPEQDAGNPPEPFDQDAEEEPS